MVKLRSESLSLQCKTRCKRQLSSLSFRWGRRIIIAAVLIALIQLSIVIYHRIWKANADTSSWHGQTHSTFNSRKLLSNENDTHEGAIWERCNFEKAHTPHAFLPFYIFLIFTLFLAIAIICDDFFVPSLEAISEKLDLSEDVAGATFMAAGSSAPELFTSVAGVGVSSDVGVGTIVGSAMFNILIIVAMSAAMSGQTLSLDWRPLFRDSVVYTLSIALFIGFSWDTQFDIWEAIILLLLYVAYIGIMKFNPSLMKLLEKVECAWCRNESRIEPTQSGQVSTSNSAQSDPAQVQEQSEHGSDHTMHTEKKHRFVHSHGGELSSTLANRRRSIQHSLDGHQSHSSGLTNKSNGSKDNHHRHLAGIPLPYIYVVNEHEHEQQQPQNLNLETGQKDPPSSQEQISTRGSKESRQSEISKTSTVVEDAVLVLIPCFPPIRATPPDVVLAREEGKLGWIKFVLKWILFVLAFPFIVAFTWTIPNCSTNRKWYVVTSSFLMCILWIAIISFGMVTLVSRCGCILSIDQFTMGLVVIAIGTSVPDCLSSILVARDGFGNMAVSNAIGSNIFDINLGLGLPFLIKIAIQKGQPFRLLSEQQMEDYEDGLYDILPHVKFGFLLLFILFLALAILSAFRFRLNKWTGLCFVCIYILFLIYAFIQELLPACNGGRNC